MKGFYLDSNGDVAIKYGRIALIEGSDLIKQTIQQVLNTNKGEWWLNEDEGIDFHKFVAKSPDADEMQAEISAALQLIDDSFVITEFSVERAGRSLTVHFKARSVDGTEIGGEQTYGT